MCGIRRVGVTVERPAKLSDLKIVARMVRISEKNVSTFIERSWCDGRGGYKKARSGVRAENVSVQPVRNTLHGVPRRQRSTLTDTL